MFPSHDQTAVVNTNATFTVTPVLTDTTQGGLTYQWSLNGSAASDGTVTTTSTQSVTTNKYSFDNTSSTGKLDVTIPDDATEVRIEIGGGRGGSGGNYLDGTGGGSGYGRRATFTLPDGGRDLELYIGTAGATGTRGGNNTNFAITQGGTGGSGNSNGGGGGSGS